MAAASATARRWTFTFSRQLPAAETETGATDREAAPSTCRRTRFRGSVGSDQVRALSERNERRWRTDLNSPRRGTSPVWFGSVPRTTVLHEREEGTPSTGLKRGAERRSERDERGSRSDRTRHHGSRFNAVRRRKAGPELLPSLARVTPQRRLQRRPPPFRFRTSSLKFTSPRRSTPRCSRPHSRNS